VQVVLNERQNDANRLYRHQDLRGSRHPIR
jgi:hypothetical protein